MTRIAIKLAFAGLRRRPLQALLTTLVVAVATAALTLALGVGRVADRPWERTFAATNAPHATALTMPGGPDLRPLEQLPGVVGSTGVRPLVLVDFRHGGHRYGLNLVGVGSRPPAVDRPLLVDGRWPRLGEILLERSFARHHGFAPGDRLGSLEASGVAVVSRGQPYPRSQPGTAYALVETIERVRPDRSRWAALVGVRLADPDAIEAFGAAALREVGPTVHVGSWREDRDDAREETRTAQVVLSVFSLLLLLAAGAVLATLVGGRVLAQIREVGLLKAAGLSPRQVASVFVLEQLAVGAVGVAGGILAGTLATPLFVGRSASLLEASEIPPFSPARVALVAIGVLALVALCAGGPALRAARRTTGSILTGSAGGSRSRLGGAAEALGLPLPVELGVRDAFRHPGRAALTTLALALTVACVSATLAMEATLALEQAPSAPPPGLDFELVADTGEAARLRPIVYGLDIVLLIVAVANVLATVLLGVRERVRDLGLLKAAGLTPRQLAGAIVAGQGVLAAGAVVLGFPLGLALFRAAIAADGGGAYAFPAWWSVAVVAPATIAAVVGLALPLSQRAASIRVADALRYE